MSGRTHVSISRPLQSRADAGETTPAQSSRREFSDELRSERRRERTRDALNTGADILSSVVGGPFGAVVRAIQGRGSEQVAGSEMQSMWDMQAESREFNQEYLALQQQMQADNQQFQALSNLMKAKHDTARAAISNMRV